MMGIAARSAAAVTRPNKVGYRVTYYIYTEIILVQSNVTEIGGGGGWGLGGNVCTVDHGW